MPSSIPGTLDQLQWRRFSSQEEIEALERNHPAARAFPEALDRKVDGMMADGVNPSDFGWPRALRGAPSSEKSSRPTG
jgi:hypothetical protein